MKIFSDGKVSTPILQKVKTAQDVGKWNLKRNLNDIIKNMFDDKVAFCESEQLNLSEYPEMKDVWYGQIHPNVFCNLTSLVVQRCDFLPNVLFPSNILQALLGLEELEVRDCDSLEAVFDVKGIQSKEILVKQTTKLKKLTLSSLPKLKHIWNEDPHERISFGKLEIVDVVKCQSLLNIFSLSLCQELGHLEILQIWFCGVQEVVAMEDGSMQNSISFPQMIELTLIGLTNLKSFYPGKHTLECPSLQILNVYQCEALRMFSFNHLVFPQPDQVDDIHDMPFRIALFSIEKVSPNLKELSLYAKDAMKILNGCCRENLFQKVDFLRLQCFEETPVTYLSGFHAMFPNVATLQVRRSSFGTLFLTAGIHHPNSQSPKQIRNLLLLELEQLRCIWEEDFPGDHFVVQDLEGLRIISCPNLITLAPSSLSFKKLTDLEVVNCKGLIYLITTITAKSLVQLKRLKIENCEMVLDVVKFNEDKADEDIIFENMEIMDFTSLSSFRSFCYGRQTFIFPSLLHLNVEGCPQMEIFSSGVTIAPFLTAVQVENNKKRWKDDLNTTIKQLFVDQEVSRSTEK